MAQPLVSRIGASPVWRAGLASAFILGLAGFAAGVIPQACRSNFVICPVAAPSGAISADVLGPGIELVTVAPKTAAKPAEVAAGPAADEAPDAVAAIDTTMLKQQPAALTRNDLIAQTFAALDVEMVSTPGELVARKVRTVTIGPDGMPVIEAAPTEVAAAPVELVAEPAAVEPDVQVAEAEPEPAVEEEPAVVEEEEPTASAYAPVRGGSAEVGRQGANVRSAPKTGGSDVLFALAAGEDVTVTETSKGWSKIVDSRGRSGWVWNQLLRR